MLLKILQLLEVIRYRVINLDYMIYFPDECIQPIKKCIIEDCGELAEGEDDGIPVPADGDIYEDYPMDQSGLETTAERMVVIEKIKSIGNDYFKAGEYKKANTKYEKVY